MLFALTLRFLRPPFHHLDMGTLSQAKTIGGIGSVLAFVPGADVAGWILVLIAGKYISDETKDRSIFNNLLYAAITVIAASLIASFLFFFSFGVGALLGALFMNPFAMFGAFILPLVAAWILGIVASLLLKSSYDKIAQKLNVGHFRTAALFFLIGSILLVIFVGVILILVGLILQAVAYFSIPEQLPQAQPASPAPQGG